MERRKTDLESYLIKFFDNFSESNSKVFSDLKRTIQENESNMMMHMESIKNNVAKYFNEAPPEKDNRLIRFEYDQARAQLHGVERLKPVRMTKKDFEELNEETKGFMKLQMDKVGKIHKLFSAIHNLRKS